MLELDLIVQSSVDPALAPAIDRRLMDDVARAPDRRGVLRVYRLAGDVVSLCRYHLAPAERGAGPTLIRRHAGGRAWPHGEGFAGLSLIVPHRSALVSDDPFALAPHQVPNRCVRGILAACRRAGIDAFYPGRDLVTATGRVLGALAFEVDSRGILLFEAVLSIARGFDALAALLDAADPGGEIVAEPWSDERTTSLSRLLGREVALEELADLLRGGLEDEFPVETRPAHIADDDRSGIEALAIAQCSVEQWMNGRRRRAAHRRVTAPAQIGVLEALLALGARGEIDDVVLAGDFIANAPAIEVLEQQLRSRRLERFAIAPVIEEVFSKRENFILGIGKPSAITDLLLRAAYA